MNNMNEPLVSPYSNMKLWDSSQRGKTLKEEIPLTTSNKMKHLFTAQKSSLVSLKMCFMCPDSADRPIFLNQEWKEKKVWELVAKKS